MQMEAKRQTKHRKIDGWRETGEERHKHEGWKRDDGGNLKFFKEVKQFLPSSTSWTLILNPLFVTKVSDLNCTFAHVPAPEVQ